ncbi:hypothetical protein ACFPYI_16070 [Halomarina salina]|uniref:Gins51 C-terminal domain-containing protein n=1 Tax=Halomarina salina TaxID=1872699 RepID=A0ABD5RR90_9EURY|nr:hypothetical protein [Halomarina salina]
MNLDELQTAQSRERQTDSLQQLRESFYEDAGQFISQLREERKRASERADDPFDAPEVRRLTDDIKTAERTVEAIYERRIGKLVKQASLEAAGMAADASGLTREEQDVFETLVTTIENNRVHVLDEVIAGERQSTPTSSTPSTEIADEATSSGEETTVADDGSAPPTADASASESSGVDAADLMGSGGDAAAAHEEESSVQEVPPDATGRADDSGPAIPPDTPLETEEADVEAPEDDPTYGADPDPGGTAAASAGDATASEESRPVDRTTVRITRDVGEILGVDQRAYDLKSEDVVTLPTPNAEPLVDRDAAERLD